MLLKYSILFQQTCGFEYTSKLQKMFQDIGVSKDLNENFRNFISESKQPLDCEFFLLPVQSSNYKLSSSAALTKEVMVLLLPDLFTSIAGS